MEKISNFSASDNYAGIHFFNKTDDALPIDKPIIQKITRLISQNEHCEFQLIEIVFVDEQSISKVNQEYLDHDYVTDIITFRYDENTSGKQIEGTLYCCAPRIREQAADYKSSAPLEFRRVVIHGLLHLAGYDDQSNDERDEMRTREDFYLNQL